MKKYLSFFLALIFVLSFVACTGTSTPPAAPPSNDTPGTPAPAPADDKGLSNVSGKTFYIGTSGQGGAFYPFGQTIGTLTLDYCNLTLVPEATAGAIENARLVGTGELEFGISAENNIYDGINKSGWSDLMVIGRMYPSYLQIIVPADSSINTVEDLKGKRVACGEAGGGAIEIFSRMLETYDMTVDDFVPSYLAYGDGFTQLADGNVDCALVLSGAPNSAITEYGVTHKFKFVKIADANIAKLLEKYPVYMKTTITSDVYGLSEDVTAVSTINCVAVNKNVDDDVVYWVTKTIFENLDKFRELNVNAKHVELESAMATSVPIHPGAQRYYDEVK